MTDTAERAWPFRARPSLSETIGRSGTVVPILMLAGFIFGSTAFRPLLTPDETRYLTVAWEMWLKHDFIVPTINGVLYDQKPPLLFWLIDLSWAIFGVSRAAAIAAVFSVSTTVVLLTRALALELWPTRLRIADRVGWMMTGNAIFVIYSGLILFDLLVTACISAALLAMLVHARSPRPYLPVVAGLAIGLSLVAKGPVALIFLAWPLLAYPLWRGERQVLSNGRFYRSVGIALALSLLPILCWLVPLGIRSGYPLIHDLVWGQAAGRISGKLVSSHARPFWFYLPLLPAFALPWLVTREFWFAVRACRGSLAGAWRKSSEVRLLAPSIGLAVLIFSLISGKQPHYLVPILPSVVLCLAWTMRNVPLARLRTATAATLAIALVGQRVAYLTVFRSFDLSEIATVVGHWPEPIGVVGSYRAELGFMSRLGHPLPSVDEADAASWLVEHPDGLLISFDRHRDETLPGQEVYSRNYRGDRRIVAITSR